ncbi:MAG: hypothetical protein FD126_971, partial [Elusimicrobia bacterium]
APVVAAPETTSAPASAPAAAPAWKARPKRDTSWQGASKFYDDSVGEAGHFYHQTVVLPGVMKMLRLGETECVKFLDLACGQGVMSRALPLTVEYWGVDLAEDLLASARKQDVRPTRRFIHADACGPLPFDDADFTHAACVLALQNVERPEALIATAAAHLAPGGRLVLAMNHPAFRIPKQSSWGEDMRMRIRYRRMDRYLSRQRIAIKMNPSLGDKSPETWSFHAPLSDIFLWFRQAGLYVEHLEEWVSNKKSAGPASVMENRARAEFPLFLALSAIKPR